MRSAVPITLILLTSLSALGLLLYGSFSDRWVKADMSYVEYLPDQHIPEGLSRAYRRLPFLKRFGLFCKCTQYKWLNVVDLNSTNTSDQFGSIASPAAGGGRGFTCNSKCAADEIKCGRCCVKANLRCNNVPECDSLDDELNCPRLFNDDTWLDEPQRCFRQRINVLNFTRSRTSVNRYAIGNDSLFTHNLMVWMLVGSATLQLIIAFGLALVELCRKHLAFPFALLTLMAICSFLAGVGAIGLFLWTWVHEKINLVSFELASAEAVIHRLNPWLSQIERLDISFYITCAGVGMTMITMLICLLFCCGITVGPRMNLDERWKGSYEVVKVLPYEDHYGKS